MKSLAILGVLYVLGITVNDMGNTMFSDMLMYSIASTIAVGIWKCATILNDIRRDLRDGHSRMDKQDFRINEIVVRLNAVDKGQETPWREE